ncbi:hypothetical protein LX15_004742 [Streptoalloteichus tenebrarius]|uniref:VOC domain-containing protein n=1 Tax=Streptoalloteichus tenebrarius (strain ATCC 17920 / DSM 40477 / JCM 4838 / CBS 697.72 / NBRC 16177 / NCIMB 11028 / NRRL B-12390 / A12253. 1 / ISP 5477) TaxID=1933 RepID=A0ABT1HZQ6_STRSD|nr:VOC family protein [Streptoalloteichus tenebrarius]MCP2261022.1 hypothetical protein [Streptoalloteichus tenebrarius]BFF03185.1 VOC family protein [Streptoalloteichus tenebrarius]
MRIKLAEIYVDDQDRARTFYTEVLGFQVSVDASYGENARWLAVVSPEDPDGTQLLLSRADGPSRAFQQAVRAAGSPATALTTDDCEGDYHRLSRRGVEFTMPPTRMGYGGIDAIFDDTCGNLICLHQD